MSELSYPEKKYRRYKRVLDKTIHDVESLLSSEDDRNSMMISLVMDRMIVHQESSSKSVDKLLDLARIKYSSGTSEDLYDYAEYVSKLLSSETLDNRAIISLLNLNIIGAK